MSKTTIPIESKNILMGMLVLFSIWCPMELICQSQLQYSSDKLGDASTGAYRTTIIKAANQSGPKNFDRMPVCESV